MATAPLSLMEVKMKRKVTWFLIGDGARARMFANDGPGKGLKPALGYALIANNKPSRELGSDSPGRSFSSAGSDRHAMQPPTDPHRHEQREFAKDIADLLAEQQRNNAFDRLIIAAAPQMLGDLRAALTPQLRDMVHEEINKDFTKATPKELEKHLDEYL